MLLSECICNAFEKCERNCLPTLPLNIVICFESFILKNRLKLLIRIHVVVWCSCVQVNLVPKTPKKNSLRRPHPWFWKKLDFWFSENSNWKRKERQIFSDLKFLFFKFCHSPPQCIFKFSSEIFLTNFCGAYEIRIFKDYIPPKKEDTLDWIFFSGKKNSKICFYPL